MSFRVVSSRSPPASASSCGEHRRHVVRRLQLLVVLEDDEVVGDDLRLGRAQQRRPGRRRCSAPRPWPGLHGSMVSTGMADTSMPYSSLRPAPHVGRVSHSGGRPQVSSPATARGILRRREVELLGRLRRSRRTRSGPRPGRSRRRRGPTPASSSWSAAKVSAGSPVAVPSKPTLRRLPMYSGMRFRSPLSSAGRVVSRGTGVQVALDGEAGSLERLRVDLAHDRRFVEVGGADDGGGEFRRGRGRSGTLAWADAATRLTGTDQQCQSRPSSEHAELPHWVLLWNTVRGLDDPGRACVPARSLPVTSVRGTVVRDRSRGRVPWAAPRRRRAGPVRWPVAGPGRRAPRWSGSAA